MIEFKTKQKPPRKPRCKIDFDVCQHNGQVVLREASVLFCLLILKGASLSPTRNLATSATCCLYLVAPLAVVIS